jgi:predicted Zn-dependent protease
MPKRIRWAPVAPLCICLVACATRPARVTAPCATAGSRLSDAWQELKLLRQSSNRCDPANGADCEALRAQIERLSVDCPANSDVLMANALLAFEDHNLTRAQQLLDELAANGSHNPDGAVMRARIALEQGNLQYALKFLNQQIRQSGDHPGLRETYASALFLAGQWEQAGNELLAAGKLGAPLWRIAYGQGLIEEAQGRFPEARRRYLDALQAKPGWKQAESRLRALVVSGKVPESSAIN